MEILTDKKWCAKLITVLSVVKLSVIIFLIKRGDGMSVPDKSIDPKLLESAKKEFLANGFEKTSLKAICDGAGVTTGALYKRYESKEDLFSDVVAPVIRDLNGIIDKKSSIGVSALTDKELIDAWNMKNGEMEWWFRFLYERREGFVLLICRAEGTEYSNFQHDWVEKMSANTGAYLEEAVKRGLVASAVSKEELHILLSAFWTTIYEPFIHDFTWEQIEEHCSVVCRFFDWRRALEMKEEKPVKNG